MLLKRFVVGPVSGQIRLLSNELFWHIGFELIFIFRNEDVKKINAIKLLWL